MDHFRNQKLTFKERAADLVSRMTLEEKITQVGAWTAAVPRLGIPAFHYSNECSHGINALNYVNNKEYDVTSFPVCLAMSQSWDVEKMKEVSSAISDEARAFHNVYDDSLSFWAPTINLSRDPRNGRSDENFGEDPFLAGKMAVAYISGLQGDDATYRKAAATPKHFMMNSSENNRLEGSSYADEATMREYYGKVFEYAIKEGKAESVMISYNRIGGVPAAANTFMLDTLLREEWGFDGYVTSDCGAVAMTYATSFIPGMKPEKAHYYFRDEAEASAGTLIAGTDLSCGAEHRRYLKQAVDRGLISEDVIDRSAIRNLTSLFRQGIFDDRDKDPYKDILPTKEVFDEHHALSVDMANDTIVLLKNEKNLLPLQTEGMKKILVVGPNAKFRELGGYSCGGVNVMIDTTVDIMAYDGIREAMEGSDVKVCYEKGWCSQKERRAYEEEQKKLQALPGVNIFEVLAQMNGLDVKEDDCALGIIPKGYKLRNVREDEDAMMDDEILFARALESAKDADVVIMVAGTDSATAAENADRYDLDLPIGQNEKIKEMLKVNPNTVVVLVTLGCVTGDALDEAHTLLNAHFAGEAQGTAIANVLFGKVNPNAKLSATWYRSVEDLPHLNDYGLKKQDTLDGKARTYWYFDKPVRFPFGYGLSYTTYVYSNLSLEKDALSGNDTLRVSLDVTNTGAMDGAEVVELYIRQESDKSLGSNKPIRQLKGFKKVFLTAGETKRVEIDVPLSEVTFWSNFHHAMEVETGTYIVEVGPDSKHLPLKQEFRVTEAWNAALGNVYAVADRQCFVSGDKGQIKVSAVLENAVHLKEFPVIFSSSDERVANVDESGKITARESGTALITASVTYKNVTKKSEIGIAVR